MFMMMVSQSQAQCWAAMDPNIPTYYSLISNSQSCLDNALIPRNATQLYTHWFTFYYSAWVYLVLSPMIS